MIYTLVKDNKKYKFDVSIKEEYLDKSEMIKLFLAIKELKSSIKNLKRGTSEYEFIKSKIQIYRNEVNTLYAYKIFQLTVKLGTANIHEAYIESPNKDNIKNIINELLSKLKEKRKSNKIVKQENHDMNGINYNTTGGVFTSKNTILKLQETVNTVDRIRRSKKPHSKIKDNYIGVELELLAKINRNDLEKKFIEARLAGNIHIKDDGSIQKENKTDFPHEVTILCKQTDYIEVIQRVCSVLNSKEVDAFVNNSCGMHVHFDVRNRKPEKVFTNLVRLLPLLKQMVPATRVDTDHAMQYCALNNTDVLEKSKHPTGRDTRYQAVNPESVGKYKTVEVRIHSGTTSAAKIINWIKTCLFAVDSEILISQVENIETLVKRFDVTNKLKEYIIKRIELFSKDRKRCDTRADHFWITDVEVA